MSKPFKPTEAFKNGIIEVSLTRDYADLVHRAMEMTKAGPGEALAWLLDVANVEMDSGDWDGSSASLRALDGLRVLATNLDQLVTFKKGDLVLVPGEKCGKPYPIIGHVVEIGPAKVNLALTNGTMVRMGNSGAIWSEGMMYTCPTAWLQEL